MQGRRGASCPLPQSLEFEGRFMSSRPVTNNPMWWHRDQSAGEQHLPDFIPLDSDAVASHYNSVGSWNTGRLSIGQSSSSSMKIQSGYSDRLMEINAGEGSDSNNFACQLRNNASNTNLNRPVIQNSSTEIGITKFLTESLSSGRVGTEHTPMPSSSSSHSSMKLVQTSSTFREENRDGTQSAVVTGRSLEKRKFPEGSWGESSASAPKRSFQISGSSDLHTAPRRDTPDRELVLSSSSADVLGLGSSGTFNLIPPPQALREGSNGPNNPMPVSQRPRSILRPPRALEEGSNVLNNPMPVSRRSRLVPLPPLTLGEGSNDLNNPMPVSRRPRLVLPPPLTLGEGSNDLNKPMPVSRGPGLVLSAPQSVGGGSNAMNHLMQSAQCPCLDLPAPQAVREVSNGQNRSVRYPVTPQQSAQLTSHHDASGVIPRNSDFALPVQVQETGLRNITQGSHSDQIPNDLRPVPNPVYNGNRRRRREQFRPPMLDIGLIQEASNPPSREIHLHYSQGTQTMQQRVTLLPTTRRIHSNYGALDDSNASTNSFSTEVRQRLLSRARHDMFASYHGGREISAPEDGVNVRQSLLSAVANIHDQHRDMRLDVDNMSYEELLELGDRIGHVKTGLSEEAIKKCLKHYIYTCTVKSNKTVVEPCSICQEDYAEGEEMGTMECGHEYHTDCIKQWLVLKNSCPICKAPASSSK